MKSHPEIPARSSSRLFLVVVRDCASLRYRANAMLQHSKRDSIRRERYQRFVGLFVLFFVLAGVVISGFNSSREMEELLGFDLDGVSSAAKPLNNSQLCLTSSPGGQDDPVNSEGDDDDYLCWCGQVLPTESFDIALPAVTFQVIDSDNASIPTAPPRLLFHPPRLA